MPVSRPGDTPVEGERVWSDRGAVCRLLGVTRLAHRCSWPTLLVRPWSAGLESQASEHPSAPSLVERCPQGVPLAGGGVLSSSEHGPGPGPEAPQL